MPWVRGHYRRSRRTSGAEGLGCLLVVGGGAAVAGAVGTAILAAITATAEVLANVWPYLLGAALVALGVWVGLLARAWTRSRRLRAFLEAAGALATGLQPTDADVATVSALRRAAPPAPQSVATQLETLYRNAVAEMVSDNRLTAAERRRLDALAGALGISEGARRNAEVDGFLQVHATLVADERLTADEEMILNGLREALKVPDDAVLEQLAQADQLRRARLVEAGDLATIEPGIKLCKGEVCYYVSAFTEKKERVVRAYQQDGVRHKEIELVPERSGQMYITNARVLLVAGGTTNIKLDAVLDVAVDGGQRVLGLTVDGRKTPYFFDVAEPFVAAAYVERAMAGAP